MFEDTKGVIQNRKGTDNAKATRKATKGQTMIDITQYRKL
jgi:hypothetical protein